MLGLGIDSDAVFRPDNGPLTWKIVTPLS